MSSQLTAMVSNDWLRWDGGAKLSCLRCSAVYEMALPAPVEICAAVAHTFAEIHSRCRAPLVDSAELARVRALSKMGPLTMEQTAYLFSVIDDMAEDIDGLSARQRKP